jgi:LysM repeat protein
MKRSDSRVKKVNLLSRDFVYYNMIFPARTILSLVFLCFCICLNADAAVLPDSTGVKTVDGKTFIVYKVQAKESWYGIAKRYDISTEELQSANPNSSKVLKIDEEILIPQPTIPAKEEIQKAGTLREAIYYDVKKKETLYSIARTYNTIPDSLRKWNDIKGKKVKSGQRIIVGYNITIIEPPKKDIVVEKPKPVTPPSAKPKGTIKKDTTKKVNEVLKVKRAVKETGVASWISDADENANMFFALHRTAVPGTIIKVTNKMNKKYVFVKVLGALPDTGDNFDIIIKLSKSSAEKLGVRDRRFQCQLDYTVLE